MHGIIHGDSLHELENIDENTIDFICTDPPYGYSFMNRDWDRAVPSVDIWKQCLRVLKPGAFCMVMSAPRSDVQMHMISNLTDAGFNLAHSPIYWSFASGFPKSLNIAGNIAKIIDRICKTLHANIAEKLLSDTVAKYDSATSIVVESVDTSPKHMTLLVRSVASKSAVLSASNSAKITVPNSAITQACEQALSKIKGVEVLKIELGSLKSLNEQDINALCVELIENYKRTILNQYNSIQSLDTTSPMASVSATNVITTESTMERLTTSMVDMLEKRLKESSVHLKGSYGGAQFKPAVEVVLIASKPLSEKTFVDQALANGKGITWLDDCRIPTTETSTADRYKSPINNSQNQIYAKKGDLQPQEINPQGRFPANLLVSDDVLNDGKLYEGKDNFKHSATTIFNNKTKDDSYNGQSKSTYGSYSRYFDLDKWYGGQHAQMVERETAQETNPATHEQGTRAFTESLPKKVEKTLPFLITPKASKSEKNRGLQHLEAKVGGMVADRPVAKMNRNGQNPVYQNHHPTVKPLKLMSYLITLASRPGDTVLDPFVGSGTTCLAAKNLGRNYIGIEREAEYVEIARARLADHLVLPQLAPEQPPLTPEESAKLSTMINTVQLSLI